MGLAKTSVDYEKYGKDLIESYVENLAVPKVKRKLRLHYWWVGRRKDRHGSTYAYASGIVTGHERLSDSHEAETSEVNSLVNKVLHCLRLYFLYSHLFFVDYQKKTPNISVFS